MNKIIFIACLLLFAIQLPAQDSLEVHSRYLNFEVNKTPFISGGYFLQDLVALEAGIGFTLDGERDSNGLGIRLGVDRYFTEKRISPFAGGYILFEINPNVFGETAWKGSRLNFGGHWGVNVFVLKELAIAGKIGVELQLNSPKEGNNSTSFTSMTSGFQVRIFL
ncbi:MAG: hypothetical protein EH225_00900 [Calditrichaeota bacterium]|nr:hypothetical protein [Calditrichota bacterium]RQV92941.1 MAG: hypothetical protein EH221_10570 [bacterium]RQW07988.1 MAG: hypothetical protein EH225_00900 [Calditrichota bacterium]